MSRGSAGRAPSSNMIVGLGEVLDKNDQEISDNDAIKEGDEHGSDENNSSDADSEDSSEEDINYDDAFKFTVSNNKKRGSGVRLVPSTRKPRAPRKKDCIRKVDVERLHDIAEEISERRTTRQALTSSEDIYLEAVLLAFTTHLTNLGRSSSKATPVFVKNTLLQGRSVVLPSARKKRKKPTHTPTVLEITMQNTMNELIKCRDDNKSEQLELLSRIQAFLATYESLFVSAFSVNESSGKACFESSETLLAEVDSRVNDGNFECMHDLIQSGQYLENYRNQMMYLFAEEQWSIDAKDADKANFMKISTVVRFQTNIQRPKTAPTPIVGHQRPPNALKCDPKTLKDVPQSLDNLHGMIKQKISQIGPLLDYFIKPQAVDSSPLVLAPDDQIIENATLKLAEQDEAVDTCFDHLCSLLSRRRGTINTLERHGATSNPDEYDPEASSSLFLCSTSSKSKYKLPYEKSSSSSKGDDKSLPKMFTNKYPNIKSSLGVNLPNYFLQQLEGLLRAFQGHTSTVKDTMDTINANEYSPGDEGNV